MKVQARQMRYHLMAHQTTPVWPVTLAGANYGRYATFGVWHSPG